MSSDIFFFVSRANPLANKEARTWHCQDACQMRTDLMLLCFASFSYIFLSFSPASFVFIYMNLVYLAMHKEFCYIKRLAGYGCATHITYTQRKEI